MATGGEVGGTKHHSSETVQEYTCGQCNKAGRITEATHYCPECDQCYCKACLCDHDVIGRSGIQRWGVGKGSASAEGGTKDVGDEETCPKHDNVKVEWYCKNHDVVFCLLCLSTTHRTCANTTKLTKLETIESALGNSQKQLQGDSDAFSKELERMHRERIIRQRALKQSHDEYISNVESFRTLINQTFDSISKESDTLNQEYNEKFEADKLLYEHGKTKQAQLLQILERSKYQTLPFTFLKKWNEWVILQRGLLEKIRKTDIKTDFKLIAEQDIQTTLRTIEGLGKKQFGYPVCSATQQGDKEVCEVVGICQLANGNMILADASNKKLKLLDDTYTIVSSYEVESTPVAVCTVGETQVAVAMNNKTVQMVNVDNTFKVVGTIESIIACFDIAASNDELYILSGCFKSRDRRDNFFIQYRVHVDIYIYSFTGTYVRKLSVTVNGDSVVSSMSLTLIRDTGKVCVAHSGSIYYCNSKGKTLATMSICKDIISVCLDDSGLVYVGATDRNEVVTVKRDDNIFESSLKKLQVHAVESPTVLCWDKRIGRLVVGCKNKNQVYLV